MGLHSFGIPTELALLLRDYADIPTFVETGTYKGGTAAWAADHFQRVYTIEAHRDLYREAKARYADKRNVTFVHDTSPQGLAQLAPGLTGATLYWLDAHYCLGTTAGVDDQCPLLDELAVIARLPGPAYILIDDARYLLAPPAADYEARQWPMLTEIVKALAAINPDFYVVAFQDRIIAVPISAREVVVSYCQRHLADNSLYVGSGGTKELAFDLLREAMMHLGQWAHANAVRTGWRARRGVWRFIQGTRLEPLARRVRGR